MSHSTRVRGLKSQKIATVNNFKPSHSTRVRGLKFIIVEIRKTKRKVALYTSAWIEITLADSISKALSVALYTSAWIEITYSL